MGRAIASRDETSTKGIGPETAATFYVTTALLLTAIGLVNLYSATAFEVDGVGRVPGVFWRQLFWTVLAGGALLTVSRLDYRWVAQKASWILSGVALLLAFLLLGWLGIDLGGESHGAHRWLRLGRLSVQPSEVAKLGLILYVARYLVVKADRLADFRRGTMPLLAVISLVTVLIALEPDLGTALFVFATSLGLAIIGGLRVKHVLPVILLALPPFLVFMAFNFGHVMKRVEAFRNPQASYQLEQSLIALGSGGLAGVGLGAGKGKLYYLPERTTDFSFSLLGEELGFLGALLVIVLFLILVTLGTRIALEARDSLGFLLAMGITLLVGTQAVANIAVVTASVPPKGISLPFVSAGGSLQVMLFIGAGLMVSVARGAEAHRREAREKEAEESS